MSAIRKLALLGLMALALLLPMGSAFAIGEQFGRIQGVVYDQNGAVLNGVSITLTGSSLIGGPRKLFSSEEGTFAFNSLPPGKYDLKVEQKGLKTINQKGVVVQAGKNFQLYLVMELPGAEDSLTIIGDRPVVDTTSMTQGGSFSAELAGDVPTGRSYQDIATFLPGVIDVNGGNPDIHGGTFRNNRYLIDGLDVTDPVTLTFSANLNFDAIQETEVLTGGLGAEYNALGGVINVVTKSGGNDFELDASYYINNKTLSPRQLFGNDTFAGPLKTREKDLTLFATRQFNINAGGPILKDKLWYYVSFQKDDTFSSIPVSGPFLVQHPSRNFDGFSFRAKFTAQPTSKDTVTVAYNTDPANIFNRTQNPFRFVDPSCSTDPEGDACRANNAEERQIQGGYAISARWDSVIRDNLLFKAQAGLSFNNIQVIPESLIFADAAAAGDEQDVFGATIDSINLTRLDGQFVQARRDFSLGGVRTVMGNTFVDDRRTRLQIDSALTFIKDFFGQHEIKGGFQAAPTFNLDSSGTPGFIALNDDGGELVPSADGNGLRYVGNCSANFDPLTQQTINTAQTGGCSQAVSFSGIAPSENPFVASSRGVDFGVFVQDQWKPTQFVTVKPGLRFDTFNAVNTTGGENEEILGYSGFGPRFGVAWDPTHDGKTLLSFFAGRVVESGNLVIPGFVGRGAETNLFGFDAGNNTYDLGDPLLTIGGDSGVILACDPKLLDDPNTEFLFEECRPPSQTELSIIAERQIGKAAKLGVNGIWRHQYHMFEDDEANIIFNERGDGVIGGVNGDAEQSVFRARTPDEAFVDYKGLDFYLQGKPSERSNVLMSYSLSRNSGTKTEDTNTQFTLFMDNPRQNIYAFGNLPSNRTHAVKLVGGYDFDFGLSLGATYQYFTGGNFDRFFPNDSPIFQGDFVDRRAPRGFDPGADLNDPDDDFELRLPDISQLDLRAQYNLSALTGQKMAFIVDVFNVFNSSTITAVNQNDGDAFGDVLGRQGPLRVQLGIRYIY